MAKKSARQTSPKEVTGIPSPAGSGASGGVVKRIVRGGGKPKLDPRSGGTLPESETGK